MTKQPIKKKTLKSKNAKKKASSRTRKIVKKTTKKRTQLNYNMELSDKNQTIKELEEICCRYQRLIEKSPDLIYIFSSKRGALFWSPSVYDVLGFTKADFKKNPFIWKDSIHPDDAARVECALSNLNNDPHFAIEYRIKSADGKWHWLYDRTINVEEVDGEQIIEGMATDITIRKNREIQVDLLSSITQQVKDGVIATDLDYNIIYINEAFTNMYGYSAEELLGKRPDFLNAEPLAQDIQNKIYQRMVAGKNWKGELAQRKKDGSIFYVELFISPMFDDNGRLIASTSINRDVTDRRMRDNEIKKYKTIFDRANFGVATSDLQGNLTYINGYFARLHGYSPEQLLGKHLSIFHNQEQMERVNQLLDKFIAQGGFESQEIWHLKKNGDVFPMLMSGITIYDERKNPLFLAITALDMTERMEAIKKIEELSRFPKENQNPIMRISSQGELLYANPASKWLLESWKLGIGEQVTKDLLQKVIHSLNKNKKVEFELESSDKIFSITIMPINEMNYVNLYGVDITGQRLCEVEKAKTEKHVLQASKLASIGEVTAGIGHEINNPLAIIKGYIKVIEATLSKNNTLDYTIKTALETQKESVERIIKIVNGLRTYARSDSDIIEVVEINSILEETLSFLQMIYEKEGIIIEKKSDSQTIFIDGNRGRLYQVFVNLLSNAKDATENLKDRRIFIETFNHGDRAEIKFSDNGCGIKQKDIPHIFNSFYTTKEVGKGTGLGLSIIKNIVENINGTINIVSQEGKGTTFIINIPISRQATIPTLEKQEVGEIQKMSGKVLVVDDEKDIRDLLTKFLEEFGFEVEQAANGEEGLQQVNKDKYRFIITDINMPKMGGEEFIEKIKRDPNFKTKIFVISGSVTSDYTKDLPVDDFIGKPFDEQKIYRVLRKHS